MRVYTWKSPASQLKFLAYVAATLPAVTPRSKGTPWGRARSMATPAVPLVDNDDPVVAEYDVYIVGQPGGDGADGASGADGAPAAGSAAADVDMDAEGAGGGSTTDVSRPQTCVNCCVVGHPGCCAAVIVQLPSSKGPDRASNPHSTTLPTVLNADSLSGQCDLSVTLYSLLVQYPLRPPARPYGTPDRADFRPRNQVLELTYGIDADDPHYDDEAADDVAVDEHRLKSSVVPLKTHFALGTLVRNEEGGGGRMHITFIDGILQMRPDFSHLAPSTEASDARLAAATSGQSTAAAAARIARAASTFKRAESERSAAARLSMYSVLRAKRESEEPISMDTFGPESAEAAQAFDAVLLSGDKSDIAAPTLGRDEYLEHLRPPLPPVAPHGSKAISTVELARMPADAQVSQVMSRAKVLPFRRVQSFATQAQSAEQLIRILQGVAQLVQGNWVLRSERCCTERAIAVRDLILIDFVKGLTVSRQDIQDRSGLPLAELGRILKEIAVLDKETRRWRFALPPDEEFLEAHPAVAASEAESWRKREEDVLAVLVDTGEMGYDDDMAAISQASLGGAGAGAGDEGVVDLASFDPASGSLGGVPPPSRRVVRARSDSMGSVRSTRSVGAPKPAPELVEILTQTFKEHGVCTRALLLSIVQQHAESAGLSFASEAEASRETLRALEHIAREVPGRGAYVLRHAASEEIDKFRDVVIRLFSSQESVRRADVKAACLSELGESLPQNMYSKLMKELATSRNNVWTFKKGAGADSLDEGDGSAGTS